MTTVLVATTGGHLTQLVDLAARLPAADDTDRVWITHDNAQSRSLLAGERVEFLPYIGVKDVRGVLRTVPYAAAVLRTLHPKRVVSTGSGIALAFLPYLAARGVPAHYIESAARVCGPSVSGRLLEHTPRVHVYTQYGHWAAGRWRYAGSVFDGYDAVAFGPRAPIRRAVVTLGTAHEFPFRRVLDALAPILGPGGTLERAQGHPVETVWQTGGTPTADLPIEARPWLTAAELQAAMVDADLVVAHAGTGAALAALAAGCCPVLVPRVRASGEAGDDHQRELAESLAERGLAVHCRVEDLGVDELVVAAARRVRRIASPPTLLLAS